MPLAIGRLEHPACSWGRRSGGRLVGQRLFAPPEQVAPGRMRTGGTRMSETRRLGVRAPNPAKELCPASTLQSYPRHIRAAARVTTLNVSASLLEDDLDDVAERLSAALAAAHGGLGAA